MLTGHQAGVSAYWIDRDRYELADLDLEPDETRALQVAVAAVRSRPAARSAARGAVEARRRRRRRRPGGHGAACRSCRRCRRFARRRPAGRRSRSTYRGSRAGSIPYGLLLRDGFWYVVGHDHEHDELRTYRVDRIAGDVQIVGEDGAFVRPDGFDPRDAFPSDPKQLGAVGDAAVAPGARRRGRAPPLVERELGGDRVVARRRDGAIDVEVPCANVAGVPLVGARPARPRRGAVADGRARVVVARLAGARRAGRRRSDAMSPAPRRSERAAEARLRRLLVMLPWLMERGEVPLAEVAATFRMTPDEVAADLELAAMCGLPPFVDELIDVFIDDDVVVVGVPRLFTRPLRLTAPEGFALVAAGRAAMQLPGADPASAARPRAAEAGGGARRRRRDVGPGRRPGGDADGRRARRRRPGASSACGCATGRRRATRSPSAGSRRAACSTIAASGTSRRRRALRRAAHVPHRPDRVGGAHRRVRRAGRRRERPRRVGRRGSPTVAAPGDPAAAVRRPAWVIERYPVDSVVDLDDGRVEATLPRRQRALARAPAAAAGRRRRGASTRRVAILGAEAAARVLARYGVRQRSSSDRRRSPHAVGARGGGGARPRWRVASASASWWSVERDVVAGAQVGQAVGQLAVGIEPAGQVERAQPPVDAQRDAVAAGGPLEELGVEVGVVGGEHGPSSRPASSARTRARARRVAQVAAGDAVDGRGPTRLHGRRGGPASTTGRPPCPSGSTVTRPICRMGGAGRQPGRLEVDDGEPGKATPRLRRARTRSSCREPSWRVSALLTRITAARRRGWRRRCARTR